MKQTNPNADNKPNIIYPLLSSLIITVLLFTIASYRQVTNISINDNQNIKSENSLADLDEAKYKEDYILVDLANMNLSTFKKGEALKSYKIVTKGKPGSYYETPSGNYEVQAKYGDKFSSLGEVYMPNSIQFQGNYFIHGIPYHADGSKVKSTYSGGCIRLSDTDSSEVYEFAKKGIHIIVVNTASEISTTTVDLGAPLSTKLFYILLSLDVSNQERIVSLRGSKMKALNLIPYAISGDELAYSKIIDNIYDISNYESRKLKSLGINNSEFKSVEDRTILYNYIRTSKSYLLQYL